MQFVVQHGSDLSAVLSKPLSVDKTEALRNFSGVSGRTAIYGFPVVMALWVWIALPNLFPEKEYFLLATEIAICLALPLLIPFVHEMLHLLALPKNIGLKNTLFIITIDGFRSRLAASPGGSMTRNQFVWMSLLPVLVLTGIPFAFLIAGYKVPLWIGLAACINFSLSSTDILQSVGFLYYFSRNKTIERA